MGREIENNENNLNYKIYQRSVKLLGTFDTEYLKRIRTGETETVEEKSQSEYYHNLIERYSKMKQNPKILCNEALILSMELRESDKAKNNWTIAPHIIANCDCIVGYTMYRENEICDRNL